MRSKLVFGFLFFSTIIYGQADSLFATSILTDSFKRAGVYRSYAEFQRNEPSYTKDFEIGQNSVARQLFLGQQNKALREIVSEGKAPLVKGKIWGYCDGKDVYIRNRHFDRIQDIGFYCVYETHKTKGTPKDDGLLGAEATTHEVYYYCIMDYRTGKSRKLKKSTLVKHVLSKDPELLEEFKNDEGHPNSFENYVIIFNRRNRLKAW